MFNLSHWYFGIKVEKHDPSFLLVASHPTAASEQGQGLP